MKAELELAEADGTVPPVDRLLADMEEAFALLSAIEDLETRQPRAQVLVIDDDLRLADVTARGLRRRGYAAESSDVVRVPRPGEVLVLDLGLLEDLDSAMVTEMRSARPIIVTGASGHAARLLADQVAADAYLVKPVELDQLAAAIERRITEGWR